MTTPTLSQAIHPPQFTILAEMTWATYERVANRVTVGKTAETQVKGRVEPVQVYEVVGLNNDKAAT